MKRFLIVIPFTLLLSACEGTKLFYPNEQVGPAYSQGAAIDKTTGKPRAPLDVPPELKAELEVPMADEVATRADESVLSQEYQSAVAGKNVALDAKVYRTEAADLFSAVVDAMTSMNIAVHSVDSPSGIITTDWIRKGSNTAAMFNMFGNLNADIPTRHRYVTRVYRAKLDGVEGSKLEVRVIGQVAQNGRWVNKPFKQDVTEQLFTAVEEQLARMQRGVVPSGAPAAQ